MSDAVATAQQGLVEKYQPYPEYKDSGVEWLGDVPTDWRVIKLGFLATKIGSGKTPSGGATVYVDDGITFLRSQNVYDDGLRLDDVVHITPDVDIEMAHSRVKPMDILINITGASIGRTCIVPLGIGSANVNQHVCIIRLNKSEIIRFVSWAVKAQSTKAQIDNAQTGAAREGMNFEQIASLLLSLPPETECEQISDFLDYETARIDRLIAQQQRLIELLKEKRQAVISHAVTKGLNPDAPMKDSGVEWLGQVPEHWKVGSLRWYLRVSSGEYLSNQYFDVEPSESAIHPVIGGNGVMGYTSHKNQATPLVVGRVGALCGNVHLIDGECWVTDNALLIGLSGNISVNFAAHYLKSLNLNKLANQNTQPLITGTMIKDQSIAIPPLHEQSEIVEFVTQEEQKLNLLVSKAEQAIVLMQERRTALISAAVTGKIDLRGWTPPAEEAAA